MRLGGGFDFILDDYNKVAVNLEFTKLLVPTPPGHQTAVDLNGDGDFTDPETLHRNKAQLPTTNIMT